MSSLPTSPSVSLRFYKMIAALLKLPINVVGKAWTSDYGNPHDPHDFDFIYPISPLHNVPTDRVLPPTLLLTADRSCFSPSHMVTIYLFF